MQIGNTLTLRKSVSEYCDTDKISISFEKNMSNGTFSHNQFNCTQLILFIPNAQLRKAHRHPWNNLWFLIELSKANHSMAENFSFKLSLNNKLDCSLSMSIETLLLQSVYPFQRASESN